MGILPKRYHINAHRIMASVETEYSGVMASVETYMNFEMKIYIRRGARRLEEYFWKGFANSRGHFYLFNW